MGHLILSRERDQKILIGDHIEVVVVDIRGDKVRLGVKAPKDMPVHREEIARAIARERAESIAPAHPHQRQLDSWEGEGGAPSSAAEAHFNSDAFEATGSGMEGDLQSPPVRFGRDLNDLSKEE